jgi:FixJ family two-component response regulator
VNQTNGALSAGSSSGSLGTQAAAFARRFPGRPPSAEAPTVFVVDGDSSVREALDVLIRSGGWQPEAAASAEEFLARPRLMAPSCLLTELHLPGLTGLELQTLVCNRRELPIVFMTAHADLQAAVRAMKGGAIELLTKPLEVDLLLTAIHQAIEQSRCALNYLAHIETLQARYASLSAREKEVMALVAAGRLNKQVGGDLGITEFTVKVHRRRAMRKMQARSFAGLVTMMASLRRESPAMAPALPTSSERMSSTRSFTQSGRHSDFVFLPA